MSWVDFYWVGIVVLTIALVYKVVMLRRPEKTMTPVPPEVKSSLKNEKLSLKQMEIFRSGSCPDCAERNLLTGPSGGFAQNVKCGNPECGSLFNDTWVFGVERLSDASPFRLPTRQTAYRN